jgi:hypothetical protein
MPNQIYGTQKKILIHKLQSNLGDINDTQRRGRTHEEKKIK